MRKPKMTVAQFMRELGKERGNFYLLHGYLIRTLPPEFHTPTTKICAALTGRSYSAINHEHAARSIGLDDPSTAAIELSANQPLRECSRQQKKVRRQMLKALGLKEKVA